MCVKENYKSEVLLICVFIALLWGAGNINTVDLCVLTRKFNTVNFFVLNMVALCFFFKHGLVINPTQSSLTSFIKARCKLNQR